MQICKHQAHRWGVWGVVIPLLALHTSPFGAQDGRGSWTVSALHQAHDANSTTSELAQRAAGTTARGSNATDLVCPYDTCTALLKDQGAIEEKLRATEVRLRTAENKLEKMGALEKKLESLQLQLEALNSRLTASEGLLEELRRENGGRPVVAFSASVGGHGHTGPYNVATTLIFRNVLTNIGGAYNPATGIFTPPVRGVYYLGFHYHGGSEHRTKLSLHRNGDLIATASHHGVGVGEEGPENGSNGLTLTLEAGDHVYVVLGADAWVWDGIYIDTIFSGFLLNHL